MSVRPLRTDSDEVRAEPAHAHASRLHAIEMNLETANAIALRRAEIARDVPGKAAILAGIWLTMVGASAANVTKVGAIAPIFPVLGVLLCVVYLYRDRWLQSEEGEHRWAAMCLERTVFKATPEDLKHAAGHVSGRNLINSSGVETATLWPMIFFIVLLCIEAFFGKLLHVPSAPV